MKMGEYAVADTEFTERLRRIAWAGVLFENGTPPTRKRKPLWMRFRHRLSSLWYRWGPRVHLGHCDLHCSREDYL